MHHGQCAALCAPDTDTALRISRTMQQHSRVSYLNILAKIRACLLAANPAYVSYNKINTYTFPQETLRNSKLVIIVRGWSQRCP